MQEADRLDRRGRCACASASVCVRVLLTVEWDLLDENQ